MKPPLYVNLTSPGRPIGVNRQPWQEDVALHSHDNVEIAIVLDGAAEHVTPDGSWTIGRGDVIVIPIGMRHGYRACRDLSLINLGFDAAPAGLAEAQLARLPGWHALIHLEPRLRAQHEFASHLRLDDGPLAEVVRDIASLEAELRARAPGCNLVATGLLTRILVICARCFARADQPAAQALVRLAELLTWLERNFARPIAIGEMVRRAGVSKSTLCRLFRICLDTSPLDHVIGLRMQAAAARLREGGAIADVAREVGYDDANYFSRQFRAWHGRSPRAWRVS